MNLWKRLLLPRQLRVLCAAGFFFWILSGTIFWKEWSHHSNLVEAPAFILSSEVQEIPSTEGDSAEHQYRPQIRFRYLVDALPFESIAVGREDRSGTKEWAEKIVSRYPVQTKTTCYYSKSHPDAAYLMEKLDWSHAIASALGLALFLITLRFTLRARDKTEPTD